MNSTCCVVLGSILNLSLSNCIHKVAHFHRKELHQIPLLRRLSPRTSFKISLLYIWEIVTMGSVSFLCLSSVKKWCSWRKAKSPKKILSGVHKILSATGSCWRGEVVLVTLQKCLNPKEFCIPKNAQKQIYKLGNI